MLMTALITMNNRMASSRVGNSIGKPTALKALSIALWIASRRPPISMSVSGLMTESSGMMAAKPTNSNMPATQTPTITMIRCSGGTTRNEMIIECRRFGFFAGFFAIRLDLRL
jgi:hypothetical protein